MIFEWESGYDTGEKAIDADHRRIAQLINQLDGMHSLPPDSKELKNLLSFFADFALGHLESEDQLLAIYGYDTTSQQQCNTSYRKSLSGDVAEGGLGSLAIDKFTRYQAAWWQNHIRHLSQQFKPAL
jgi:hemerythrin-like metal-binding protein